MANPLEKMVMDHLKAQASKKGKPAEGVSIAVSTGDDDEVDPGLESACEDLCDAVKAGDGKAVAKALLAALDIARPQADDEPKEESDDDNSEV